MRRSGRPVQIEHIEHRVARFTMILGARGLYPSQLLSIGRNSSLLKTPDRIQGLEILLNLAGTKDRHKQQAPQFAHEVSGYSLTLFRTTSGRNTFMSG